MEKQRIIKWGQTSLKYLKLKEKPDKIQNKKIYWVKINNIKYSKINGKNKKFNFLKTNKFLFHLRKKDRINIDQKNKKNFKKGIDKMGKCGIIYSKSGKKQKYKVG